MGMSVVEQVIASEQFGAITNHLWDTGHVVYTPSSRFRTLGIIAMSCLSARWL